jgi:hypothetical protein
MKNLFYILSIIFLTTTACDGLRDEKTISTGVRIALAGDSASVELQNVPAYAIAEFRADSLGAGQWKDFFAVYEEPSDKEMRDFQDPLDGSYLVLDSVIRFTPAAGFAKGRAYFSRCYNREVLQEAEDLIAERDLSPTDGFLEFQFTIN